jgi:hypothetical protein
MPGEPIATALPSCLACSWAAGPGGMMRLKVTSGACEHGQNAVQLIRALAHALAAIA